MLGKLLKYETKATARLFIPLYLTIIVFAAINRFLFPMGEISGKSPIIYNLVMTISMFIYATLIIGLVVMTLFVLIQRFYKSLLGDEGYLIFTLPVQTWKHILGKLIIAMFWTILSIIVAFFSIMIISSRTVPTSEIANGLAEAFRQFIQYFGGYAFPIGLEAVVLMLLSLASAILTVYAAIALGHLFNKHKLLISFGMYILLRTVSQIIMSISAVILFSQDIFKPAGVYIPGIPLISGFLFTFILYFGAFTAAYFILTNYILKRKLNLE